jgi:hypothetical protein
VTLICFTGNVRYLRAIPELRNPDSIDLIEDIESAAEDSADLVNRLRSYSREVPSTPTDILVEEALTKVESLTRDPE